MANESYQRKRLPPFAMLAADLYSNRKVRKAGALGTQVFVFGLLKNAEHGRTGTFPAAELEPWYVADRLMLTEDQAAEGVKRAVAAELLAVDEGLAVIIGWDESWKRSAMTETEARMQRKHRQRDAQPQNERETKNKRKRESKRSPEKSGPESGEVRTGPDQWKPSATAKRICISRGLDLLVQIGKFRNHYGEQLNDMTSGRKDDLFEQWVTSQRETVEEPLRRIRTVGDPTPISYSTVQPERETGT